ncbi:YadA-like family protein, partial [Neisseria dentiae]|uniref:YadA-like family protein n=1 Tax=Neisseria dentiae TaxID=194197 RepID=UPI0035A1C7E7
SSKVGAGETVDLRNTDGNIKVAKSADADTVTFDLVDAISVDSVKAGDTIVNNDGVKVGDSVSLASDGLKAGDLTVGTNGKISGLENGSIAAGSKEAVNGGQLYGTADSVANALGGGSVVNADGTVSAPAYTIIDPATGTSTVANNVGDALTQLNSAVNSPLTFAGDSGSNVERKLGTTVNLKGGATGSLTDNNIAVVANGTDTLSIKLAETVNLGSNGSVTTGQTVLNNDGVKVGDKVALTSDGLKAGDVNITSAGIDAGNTQISGVKAGEQDSDAVNVAQLKAAAAASANKVAAGDNIEVAEVKNADGSTTYTVATAKDVSFDSVTAGTGANRVVLDDAGVSVGGNTYISGNGINANNQKVTNVAAGNVAAGSTDAVNGGQLHNTAASVANVFGGNATVNPDGSVSMSNVGGTGANNVNDAIKAVNQAAVEAKTTVSAGDNIVVAQSTNADGSTNYTVSTAKDLVVDSVKAGDTTLNGNGLSIANGPSVTANGLDAGSKKITNVADGEISATSKDAVNGSQLYQAYQVLGGNANAINTIAAPATENSDGTTTPAGTVVTVVTNPDGTKTTTTETNQTVAVSTDKGGNQYTLTTYNVEGQNTYVTNDVIQAVGKMNEQGIKFFHTNDGVVEPVAQGHNTEDSSASGAYATAIGYQSVASGEGAVAMGNTYTASTQIDGAQVTEVKDASGNVTGYAQSTVASGTRAIAMGTGSQALAEDSIAIGTGNVVTGKQSGAIGDPTVVTGDSAYSIGNNNTVSADNAYALGSNIKATLANSVYLGDNASATAVHTTAGGGNYTFAGANDANVAGVEDVVGVVSVGTEGETRQIQNVAAGVVSATSTDAINGSQLHYTNEAINSVANYTVNMGNQLNQRIDDVENSSNAGAATAMAVAGLPQAYMPGKSMVAVAGGVYRGESGYAVGYSSISDNGNWVIKGSATGNSRGHYGATAGVGYQW